MRRRGRRRARGGVSGGSLTLVQEVEAYGPLFEHWLNLKPWDLERMTRSQVEQRLEWIKAQQRHNQRQIEELNSEGG